jgi:hypothetical protein
MLFSSLPGKRFLKEINLRLLAPFPHSASEIIAQTARAAGTYGHGADLVGLFLVD